jgi:hypothetical protein
MFELFKHGSSKIQTWWTKKFKHGWSQIWPEQIWSWPGGVPRTPKMQYSNMGHRNSNMVGRKIQTWVIKIQTWSVAKFKHGS